MDKNKNTGRVEDTKISVKLSCGDWQYVPASEAVYNKKVVCTACREQKNIVWVSKESR